VETGYQCAEEPDADQHGAVFSFRPRSRCSAKLRWEMGFWNPLRYRGA
jgi:hypothetical protein